ncbi:MAG: polyhydroxyalkanoic acid system family protein [Candidatus Kapabacteria bacterium]|nr:polyhydroxyalkanoic acid system family protein [Candidatus Kapabacteria bacterium]
MATIHQTIETNKTVAEMRHSLDEKVLQRPEVKFMLDEHHWDGNVLHAKGKMGTGTITLEDKKVILDIQLTLFGSAAKGAIEQTITDQIKKLGR